MKRQVLQAWVRKRHKTPAGPTDFGERSYLHVPLRKWMVLWLLVVSVVISNNGMAR